MNNLYPAKPNYTGKTKGWFTCPHHDHIVEYYENIMLRVKEIPELKPENQIEIRFDHIVYVPDKLIPKYVKEACRKYEEADRKRKEASRKLGEACEKYGEAWRKLEEAWRKREEADRKYYLALKKANKNPTLNKYLKDHVENCVWNGEWLLFPAFE